jgi:hypothetical protein
MGRPPIGDRPMTAAARKRRQRRRDRAALAILRLNDKPIDLSFLKGIGWSERQEVDRAFIAGAISEQDYQRWQRSGDSTSLPPVIRARLAQLR